MHFDTRKPLAFLRALRMRAAPRACTALVCWYLLVYHRLLNPLTRLSPRRQKSSSSPARGYSQTLLTLQEKNSGETTGTKVDARARHEEGVRSRPETEAEKPVSFDHQSQRQVLPEPDSVSLCTPATQRDVDGGFLEVLARTVAAQTILPREWLVFLSGVERDTCTEVERMLQQALKGGFQEAYSEKEYAARVSEVVDATLKASGMFSDWAEWFPRGPDTSDAAVQTDEMLGISYRQGRREPRFSVAQRIATWAEASERAFDARQRKPRLLPRFNRVFGRPNAEVEGALHPPGETSDSSRVAVERGKDLLGMSTDVELDGRSRTNPRNPGEVDELISLRLRCHAAIYNQGYARNRLVEMATGSIISFVDADDGLHPIRTEVLLRQFWSYPTLKMIGHRRSEGPRSEEAEVLMQLQGVYNASWSEAMYHRMLKTGWFIGRGGICAYGHVSVRREVFFPGGAGDTRNYKTQHEQKGTMLPGGVRAGARQSTAPEKGVWFEQEQNGDPHKRQNLEDMRFAHRALRKFGPVNDTFCFLWNELTWGVKAEYRAARIIAEKKKQTERR